MARTDTIKTTASLNNVPLGEFTGFNGGELTAEDVKGAPGAGQMERSRGGRQTVGNVTVTREYQYEDIMDLARHRGKPNRFVVTRQPLDDDYNPKGKSVVYTGTLIRVAPGDGDANGDALDNLELEMSVSTVS